MVYNVKAAVNTQPVKSPSWVVIGLLRSDVGFQLCHKTNTSTVLQLLWSPTLSHDNHYLKRVQTTTAPGFCSHSLERSHARHGWSRGSEPVTWIGYNVRTRSLLLYDVISDVVFTITNSLWSCCDSFIAWISLELWKKDIHYGRL